MEERPLEERLLAIMRKEWGPTRDERELAVRAASARTFMALYGDQAVWHLQDTLDRAARAMGEHRRRRRRPP